jgi:hypothetical protein
MLNWLKSLSPNSHAVLIGVGGVAIGFATVIGAQAIMHVGQSAKATTFESASVQTADRQSPHSCKLSLRSLCGNVEPGGGRIKECMREHWNELPTDCHLFISEKLRQGRSDHISNRRLACREDARALCAEVKPGGGRIIRCLRTHTDQLQNECRRTVEGQMYDRVNRSKI